MVGCWCACSPSGAPSNNHHHRIDDHLSSGPTADDMQLAMEKAGILSRLQAGQQAGRVRLAQLEAVEDLKMAHKLSRR